MRNNVASNPAGDTTRKKQNMAKAKKAAKKTTRAKAPRKRTAAAKRPKNVIDITEPTSEVAVELLKICDKHGTLKPEHVVKAARKQSSPLHDHFDWDDGTAGEKYRRWQAAALIATVKVEIVSPGEAEPLRVRAFQSLPSDRAEGGGYRPLATILKHKDQRVELLELAKTEAATFAKKYRYLEEVGPILEAINATFG